MKKYLFFVIFVFAATFVAAQSLKTYSSVVYTDDDYFFNIDSLTEEGDIFVTLSPKNNQILSLRTAGISRVYWEDFHMIQPVPVEGGMITERNFIDTTSRAYITRFSDHIHTEVESVAEMTVISTVGTKVTIKIDLDQELVSMLSEKLDGCLRCLITLGNKHDIFIMVLE